MATQIKIDSIQSVAPLQLHCPQRSSVALKEIKSIPKIHDSLKNHKCYLNEHRWTEDVWDTVQHGFFQGTNPQFYSADNATTMISNEIKKSFPKAKIP